MKNILFFTRFLLYKIVIFSAPFCHSFCPFTSYICSRNANKTRKDKRKFSIWTSSINKRGDVELIKVKFDKGAVTILEHKGENICILSEIIAGSLILTIEALKKTNISKRTKKMFLKMYIKELKKRTHNIAQRR